MSPTDPATPAADPDLTSSKTSIAPSAARTMNARAASAPHTTRPAFTSSADRSGLLTERRASTGKSCSISSRHESQFARAGRVGAEFATQALQLDEPARLSGFRIHQIIIAIAGPTVELVGFLLMAGLP